MMMMQMVIMMMIMAIIITMMGDKGNKDQNRNVFWGPPLNASQIHLQPQDVILMVKLQNPDD